MWVKEAMGGDGSGGMAWAILYPVLAASQLLSSQTSVSYRAGTGPWKSIAEWKAYRR